MGKIEDFTEVRSVDARWRGLYYYWRMNDHQPLEILSPSTVAAITSIPVARSIHYPFDRIVDAYTICRYAQVKNLSIISVIKETSFTRILPTIGPCSLSTGLSLVINESIQFNMGLSNRKIKHRDEYDSVKNFAQDAFVCGAMAGFFATFVSYPFELTRRMMLLDEGNRQIHQTIAQCTRQRFYGGGMRAVYHGLSYSLISSSIFRGLFYGGYETCKFSLSPGNKPNSTGEKIISGYVASLFSLLLCHPLETIRLSIASNVYKSVLNVTKVPLSRVIRDHCKNPVNLTRGILLVPIKAIPVSSALIIYDIFVSGILGLSGQKQ